MKKCFDSQRLGTGTKEWADTNFNITNGCRNACLYCYAAEMADRFKRKTRAEWLHEELTTHAFIATYPKKNGVVMFPTAHDITPFNLHTYVRVAKLMLAAGNQLLIVSKPQLVCVKVLITELAPWKDQILFRFTIGSLDAETTYFWEPGASSPQERLTCLQAAYEADFKTSVSIEPMLQGAHEAVLVVDAVRVFVTETIWIGKMNQAKRRVDSHYGRHHCFVTTVDY